jgi:hypothetical protein
MSCVALFEPLHDSEGVKVVIETQSVALQTAIQSALAGMTEGRVPNVMDEGERLRQIDV